MKVSAFLALGLAATAGAQNAYNSFLPSTYYNGGLQSGSCAGRCFATAAPTVTGQWVYVDTDTAVTTKTLAPVYTTYPGYNVYGTSVPLYTAEQGGEGVIYYTATKTPTTRAPVGRRMLQVPLTQEEINAAFLIQQQQSVFQYPTGWTPPTTAPRTCGCTNECIATNTCCYDFAYACMGILPPTQAPIVVVQQVPVPVQRNIPVPVPVPVDFPIGVPVPVDEIVPVPVPRQVPYPVAVPVQVGRPVPIAVETPVAVVVDEFVDYDVPVEVPYPVPQPYDVYIDVPVPVATPYGVDVPVEVMVPVPVEVPVPVNVNVDVPVGVPVVKRVEVPYPVEVPQYIQRDIPVPVPVPVRVEVPVPVDYYVQINEDVMVPVEVPIPYDVLVDVPVEVPVPVYQPRPITVEVPVEQPYPVITQVERIIEVPVAQQVQVPVVVDVNYQVQNPVPYVVQRPVQITNYVDRPVAVEVQRAIAHVSIPVYMGVSYTGNQVVDAVLPDGSSTQTITYGQPDMSQFPGMSTDAPMVVSQPVEGAIFGTTRPSAIPQGQYVEGQTFTSGQTLYTYTRGTWVTSMITTGTTLPAYINGINVGTQFGVVGTQFTYNSFQYVVTQGNIAVALPGQNIPTGR